MERTEQQRIAHEIADQAGDLARTAKQAGLPMLAYLLECAVMEARSAAPSDHDQAG